MQLKPQSYRLNSGQELQRFFSLCLCKVIGEKQWKRRKYISVLILKILPQLPEPFHLLGKLHTSTLTSLNILSLVSATFSSTKFILFINLIVSTFQGRFTINHRKLAQVAFWLNHLKCTYLRAIEVQLSPIRTLLTIFFEVMFLRKFYWIELRAILSLN